VRKRGKRRHLRQPKNNYSGWLFIVGGFAQEARSCFDLAFSFLWISCVQCAEAHAAHGPSPFHLLVSR